MKMFGRKLTGFCRCFKLPVQVQLARHVYMYSPEPFHPIPDREPRLTTAEEAVSVITTGTDLEASETLVRFSQLNRNECVYNKCCQVLRRPCGRFRLQHTFKE